MAFISPPEKIPFVFRIGLGIARKIVGVDFLIMRLLTWYPRSALSSAVLEGLIAHRDGKLDERMLKMVRMTVSFSVGCPFCVDMNSVGWEKLITPAELPVLQGRQSADQISSLSQRERLAVEYARLVSSTPLHFPPPFIAELKQQFTEREIVILATTAAQVNYWTRLIQALGCPPAGFSGTDLYLEL